jgi:hypothetical protein
MTRKPPHTDSEPGLHRGHPHGDAASEPDYNLAIGSEGDTLIVRVSGPIDAQRVRIAYWREIVATARARHCRKLLVIDRKKGQPATPTELAELALIFSADAQHFDRVAVVEPNPKFLPTMEHGEIFGRTAGINIRIFPERKAAEHWLHFGAAGE